MAEEGQGEELPEVSEDVLAEPPKDPNAASAGDLGFVMDVPLNLSVHIGGAELMVREVLQLQKGSVIELDRLNGEPADVLVNDRIVASGEVTVVEERLAVRILEVYSGDRGWKDGKG